MIQDAIYSRQNMIGSLNIPKAASVVGVGGTGFWTAILLAMSGVDELILVDHDIVEISNLNRLPVKDSFINVKKIHVAKDFVQGIRKTTRLELHDKKIEKPEDCVMLRGAIFCCTDNLKSQQIICAYSKKNDIPYQRIGYDGTVLNVSKTFPLSFKEVNERGGYSVTPSWVVPAVLAAAIGVSSRLYNELCVMDDIGKLHIQGSSYVPEKILDEAREEREEEILDNIHDHIPDGYGYCEDCGRIDPDDDSYCDDCDEHYTEDDIAEIKEDARREGFDDAIGQIESGNVSDAQLDKALGKWKKKASEKEARNV